MATKAISGCLAHGPSRPLLACYGRPHWGWGGNAFAWMKAIGFHDRLLRWRHYGFGYGGVGYQGILAKWRLQLQHLGE